MQRPKRQAAENALAKIRDIREWETLPETSQRFKECAALIDAELEAEIKKKKVKTCDLDTSETEEEESQDKFYDAHDGFVIADGQLTDADPDFQLKEDELQQEESDDSQLSAVTEHDEEENVEEEEEKEEDEDEEEDEEDADADQCSETATEKWEDALEQFDVEPFLVEPDDVLMHSNFDQDMELLKTT